MGFPEQAGRQTVAALSEGEILDRILKFLPVGPHTDLGPGDDAAIVAAPGARFTVTTDILVEGSHFRREWSTGAEVGARAAAQNLADIAAMGATPTSLVVSMVLPPDLPVSWLEDFAGGLGAEAFEAGAGVVGGDIVAGPVLTVSVAAHGYLGGRPVTRSGAKPGDTVAVAGTLGLSAAGLAALQSGAVSPALRGNEIPFAFRKAVETFRSPKPPLKAGPLAAGLGATAMLDLSDGLVMDAGRLAKASGVRVDLSRYGLSGAKANLEDAGRALGVDPMQWVLYGGEDHGLLATFPPYVLVPEPFRAAGTVGSFDVGAGEDSGSRVTLDGAPLTGGFDHFG